MQDADRGGGLLVGADLGVGDAGVVVDDGVHERGADPGPVVLARAAGPGAVARLLRSPCWRPTNAMPAAVGDVAELGDVDVDQRAGMVVLVAAQRFAGDPVDVGEPVDPAPHQHRVHGRGRHPEPAGDLDRAEPVTPPQRHDPPHHLRAGLGRAAVRPRAAVGHPGRPFGAVAVGPLLRGARRDHEHLGRRGIGPAASTTSRASRRRVHGVRAALAWDTKASGW